MSNPDLEAKFLSTLSHDIRGGAHAVQLALEMLKLEIADGQSAANTLRTLELARRSVLDATARAERMICASRIHRGIMPVRPIETDLAPHLHKAVLTASAADEDAGHRVVLQSVERAYIRCDPRLAAEAVGGLLDHALRAVRGARIDVVVGEFGAVTVRVAQPWVFGDRVAALTVATIDPPYEEPTLGLYVAGGAARLMGCAIDVASDREVRLNLQLP